MWVTLCVNVNCGGVTLIVLAERNRTHRELGAFAQPTRALPRQQPNHEGKYATTATYACVRTHAGGGVHPGCSAGKSFPPATLARAGRVVQFDRIGGCTRLADNADAAQPIRQPLCIGRFLSTDSCSRPTGSSGEADLHYALPCVGLLTESSRCRFLMMCGLCRWSEARKRAYL